MVEQSGRCMAARVKLTKPGQRLEGREIQKMATQMGQAAGASLKELCDNINEEREGKERIHKVSLRRGMGGMVEVALRSTRPTCPTQAAQAFGGSCDVAPF